MTMAINAHSISADGVLSIDATLIAQAGYCIESLYAVCNGATVGRVGARRDWTNYVTSGSAALTTLTTATGTLLIPLWLLPNGALTFTVHGLYRNTAYGITDTAHLVEDTPVDVTIENTFHTSLLAASPTIFPEGVIVAPVTLTFDVPATTDSAEIPVTVAAVDNNAVTAYLVNESATPPLATAPGWSATAPTSCTVSTPGAHTLYAWAKDADGNVSDPVSAAVTASFTPVNVDGTVAATGTEGTAQTGAATATGSGVTAATGAQAISETGTALANSALAGSAAATGFQATAEAGTATATGSGVVLALLSVELNGEYGTATASSTSQPALIPAFYLRDQQGRMFGLRDNQGRIFAFKQA